MYSTQYPWYYQPLVDASMYGRRRPKKLHQFSSYRLPSYIDLREWMTPVEDQGETDACTANAFAGAIEYIFKRRTSRHIAVSRLFIYYNGRMIQEQSFKVTDDGLFEKHAVLGLRKFGVCEEFVWPYDSKNVNQTPPPYAYAAASQLTVIPLQVPHDLLAMKTCLANGVPFLIAVKFLTHATDEAKYNGGFVSIPNFDDPEVSTTTPHVVLVVGYDDHIDHFIVRNSWGRHWGADGYFYIPYAYLLETNLAGPRYGVWAILDIVRNTGHLPSVRQLVVPGHSRGAQY